MKQINCFGKINRVLRVGPSRPDGFHELFTIYQSISLHDTLSMELTKEAGITLTLSDLTIPSDKDNIVWQAAELVMKQAGYCAGVSIHIEKRIPSGGGLGGGSSDAAGTLLFLNRMLNDPLSRDDLMKLACVLGSDVPFFLIGGTAEGTGRGELIRPLPDGPAFSFFAVFPKISFSTGEMYSLLDREKAFVILKQMTANEVHRLLDRQPIEWENSFDSVVSAMSPEVAEVMQEIRKEGFPVMLAGSGSTFLIFGDQDSLERVKGRLPAGWKGLKLRTRTRQEVLDEYIF